MARFLCTLIFSESIWVQVKTVLVAQNEAGFIPEFPLWIILPLFLIATLYAIVIKKKVNRPIS